MTILLLGGLAVLLVGGELLVRGAASLAASRGVPPLIVGLTVVSFGTSAPEVAVSVRGALQGAGEIAVGNVLGSNIFNVLAILGISALLTPLVVKADLVRRDVPVMVLASMMVVAMAWDGVVSGTEGVVLVAGVVAYTGWLIRAARVGAADTSPDPGEGSAEPEGAADQPGPAGLVRQLSLVAVGLVFLYFGSNWFVQGAVELARSVGLSELVIGLTVVAMGTSMPEVAASVVAALRGQRDIAVGNVVGSNIFNLFFVLGGAAVVSSGGLRVPAAAQTFDLPVMTAVAVACLPIFFSDHMISRWEGVLFLVYFAAYTAFLVLDETGHQAAPVLAGVMLAFVVPITVVALGVVAIREFRVRGRARGEEPPDSGP